MPLAPEQITLRTIDEGHHIRSEFHAYALPTVPTFLPTLFGALLCFRDRVRWGFVSFLFYKFYRLLFIRGKK